MDIINYFIDNIYNYNGVFSNDLCMVRDFPNIIKKYKPDIIIETGTYKGYTTKFLASLGIPLITIEINADYQAEAREYLKEFNNVTYYVGDSPSNIEKILPEIQGKKIIFFLDSHWDDDQSLERELKVIKNLKVKPFIIIHDFYVPNSSLKFDTYKNSEYNYEYFKPYFDEVYGKNNYNYYYNNDSALGSRVGIIFLNSKEDKY
jgi:cephalosporin hydroxylase